MKWFNQLRQDPIGTIADWQDMRWPWILMAAVCVLLVLVAHYMFQVWLYMAPCEQCVYIRFGFLVMAIGGLLCAINPKNLILKVLGYVFAFAGAIYGLKCSVKLAAIHHAIHSDDPTAMFGMQGCSTDPHYPFDLPLAQWAPDWFKPTGDCGYDLAVVPDGTQLSSLQQWFIDMYNSSDSWYLIPKFSELFGMPLDAIIAMGTAVNASITSLSTLVLFAVVPFNIVKGVLVSILTMLLYKRVEKVFFRRKKSA